ncbi:MAG: prepilin-type N-terminal cleavage/methylation domain-containing protein [Rickettsiales bacterium]|jgi:prepilin-type N-terminal cleavage/methylation domain-containing protein
MQKKHKKAFSLVELSIVVLIVSVLIASAIGISRTATNDVGIKITKDRMEVVYDALTNFVATNKRLPCPALLGIVKGENSGTTTEPINMLYGQESGASETANIGTGSCNEVFIFDTYLAYGAIPTRALGLSEEMAEDGFGTKFSYVVDRRFTRRNTGIADFGDGFEVTRAMPSENGTEVNIITIQSPATTSLMTDALFVIISHGINKIGGVNASSISENPLGFNVDGENFDDENSNIPNIFDATFINSSNTANTNFDDLLLFKNKAQLLKDAGAKNSMMCSFNDLIDLGTASVTNVINGQTTTETYLWEPADTSGNYGCVLCSSNEIGTFFASATCGKYGIWSLNSRFSTTLEDCVSDCL